MPRRSFLPFVVLLVLGCSGKPPLGRVEGVVTLDTKPLAGVSVTFMPEGGGRPATGVSDDQGQYRLTTTSPDDGAMIGKHRVALSLMKIDGPLPAAPPPGTEIEASGASGFAPPPTKQLLPERYVNPATSGFSFEVKAGSNRCDLPLTSK